jgi:peptidoglycan/LPS O-acetylase OafA/YrhL
MGRTTFPGLDTLRAIASISVVATHTSFWAGVYGAGLLGAMTQRLEVGVAIFFVLSGFLLSRPWFVQQAGGRPADGVRRYAWKRALRVLPVYWVVVVVALLVLPENRGLSWTRWLENLLLVDVFRHDELPHGLTQMWSLSTEATFYVALPALAVGLLAVMRPGWRPGRALLLLAVGCLASLAWIAVSSADPDQGAAWVRRGLPAYLTWFAAGMALAVVDVDRRTPEPRLARVTAALERASALPGTCWLLAGAVFVVASTPIAGPASLAFSSPSEAVCRHLAYVAVALLLVTPSVLGDPSSRYARAMARPWARHLGHTSYSLFCCHIVVLELIGDRFGFRLFDSDPFVLLVVTLGLSLVVAELLYRTVELPFLRLKDRRRPRDATSAATTTTTAS